MTARRSEVAAAIALACAAASALLGACASDEDPAFVEPPPDRVIAPAEDAGPDTEAGPCATGDCEFFPSTCTPEVLCPNGPFDPVDPTAGMNWQVRIQAINGRSPSDVWIAGGAGTAAHYDGTSWRTSDVGTQESLSAVWPLASGEVSFGLVEHIYGRGFGAAGEGVTPDGWSLRPTSLPQGFNGGRFVTAAWGTAGSEALWFAAGNTLWRLRLTPASELEILPGAPPAACPFSPCRQIRSIHGASAGTLWAVGDMGGVVRITNADGDAPTATQLHAPTWTGLAGVWAASDTDVWVVGGMGAILHYTGDPLREDMVPDVPTNANLNAVWGRSASDIWAVGSAGVVLHFDGTRWSRVKIAALGERRPDLGVVWAPAEGQVWIGGRGVLLTLGGKP